LPWILRYRYYERWVWPVWIIKLFI